MHIALALNCSAECFSVLAVSVTTLLRITRDKYVRGKTVKLANNKAHIEH